MDSRRMLEYLHDNNVTLGGHLFMSSTGPVNWNPSFSFGSTAMLESMVPPKSLAQVIKGDIERVGGHTGISAAHLQKLHSISVKHNCVIAFRPVDPHNAQLLEMGYPTKGLEVKGKSSNVGLLYGFVPVNQAYSRLDEKKPEAIASANKKIKESLNTGNALKTVLELPPERINYLLDHDLVRFSEPNHYLALSADGRSFLDFSVERISSGNYQVSLDGEPVEVLTPNISRKPGKPALPFTADYDLFFLMPQWSNVQEQSRRRSSIKPLADGEQPAQLRSPNVQIMRQNFMPKETTVNELSQVDYVTMLEERVIADINESLRGDMLRSQGSAAWKLVHHGSDEGNPATEMRNNFPAIIIAPKVLEQFGTVAVLRNEEELVAMLVEARKLHYVLTANRKWIADGMQTDVNRRGQALESRLNTQSPSSVFSASRPSSLVSGSESRRGSGLAEADLAILSAAAERRQSLPHLASLPVRRPSLAPNSGEAE